MIKTRKPRNHATRANVLLSWAGITGRTEDVRHTLQCWKLEGLPPVRLKFAHIWLLDVTLDHKNQKQSKTLPTLKIYNTLLPNYGT